MDDDQAGAAGAAPVSGAPASAAPAEGPAASAAASAAAAAEAASGAGGEAPPVDTAGGGEDPVASPAAASEAPASAGAELYMTVDRSGDPSRQSGVAGGPAATAETIQPIPEPSAPTTAPSSWAGGGALLLALGLALVLLRWAARRLA
jgi:hypothetical protein